jgi:hypothetical protein
VGAFLAQRLEHPPPDLVLVVLPHVAAALPAHRAGSATLGPTDPPGRADSVVARPTALRVIFAQ